MNRGLEYYNLAVQYVKDDNLNQAICYFKMAIDFDCFEAAYDLALLYLDEEKYELSIEPALLATKHGFFDAEKVLIEAYAKTGDFKKCLNVYFKKKRVEVDVDIEKVLKDYVKKTVSDENFTHIDIDDELNCFVSWKNSPAITDALRVLVLKQRSILFNEFLKQNLSTLKTADDFKWFESLLEDYQVKCRVDNEIVVAFNRKRAVFEAKGKSLKQALEESKGTPYYPFILEESCVSSINKILSKTSISRDEACKLKELIGKLQFKKASQYTNCLLQRINEDIKKGNYDEATNLSYGIDNISKHEEILRSIAREKIENQIVRLKKRPSNDFRAKRELADIYMHSNYAPLRDTAKGLNLLEECFLHGKSQSAFLELLSFYRSNGYREHVFYLLEKAHALGLALPDGFERIYIDRQTVVKESLDDKQLIKKELNRRGIRYLLHFTSLSNLSSIKKYGILSRVQLEKLGISYKRVDSKRLDNQLDRISLSITKHNEFFLKKALDENLISKPILLRVDANVLIDSDVVATYYVTNAANNKLSKLAGSSIKEFNNMFKEELVVETSKDIRIYNRKNDRKQDNETTDLQAEVMIDSIVPLKYIKFVYDFDKKIWEPFN